MSSFWDHPGAHYQYVAASIVSVGGLCLGTSMAWSTPAKDYIITEEAPGYSVDLNSFVWISSLLGLGCCLIALPIVEVGKRLGLKMTLILMVPLNIGAWALLILAPNKFLIMVARFVQGLCVGSYVVLMPIYCIEIGQPEAKRAIRVFFVFLNALGYLYSFTAGIFNNYMTLNYACGIIPAIYMVLVIWIPESPVFYLIKNKPARARRSLFWLRGRYVNVDMELFQIQASINRNKENNPGVWNTLKMKITRRALVRCIGLMFFQSSCGGPAILTFVTFVMKEAKPIIPFSPKYTTIILGGTFVAAAFTALLTTHWIEKRSAMIFSVWLLIIIDVMLVVYFHLRHRDTGTFDWVPMICLSCYTAAYGMGLATLPYSLIIDLFPEHFCNIGIGICFFLRGLFIFVSVQTFPRIIDAWGIEKFFCMLFSFSLLANLFLFFFIPKTKGKTSSEIHEL